VIQSCVVDVKVRSALKYYGMQCLMYRSCNAPHNNRRVMFDARIMHALHAKCCERGEDVVKL